MEEFQSSGEWFYDEGNGKRPEKGHQEAAIIRLINNGTLSYGSLVWKKGFPDWVKIEDTDLRQYLSSPPPISISRVNNTAAWLLVVTPIIGAILEPMAAAAFNLPYEKGDLWGITAALNIIFFFIDLKILRKAGYTSQKLWWGFLFVPVYFFVRARHLKQKQIQLICWIVAFFLSFFI